MRSTLAVAAAIALALALGPRTAAADPTPEVRAAATALFDDGRRLMQANDFAAACPKLEAAQRMDPGIGILFNLADCYERIGKTASAWSSFRDVAAEAASKNQADREKAARARAAALEPKLMKLRIVAADPPPGLEVTRDGVGVASGLLGSPFPVDPGKHVVAAKAPGKEPWQTTVSLDVAGNVVTVNVPALAAAAAGAMPTAPIPVASAPVPVATAPDTAPTPPAGNSSRPWQKPLGIGVAGVGVVGVGIGVAIGFMAKSSFDQSNEHVACDAEGACTSSGQSLRASALSKGNVATVLVIAGGVVAAGGVVLWLTAPSAPAQVGLGPRGLVARGTF